MPGLYTVEQIRAAEEHALARLPDGILMQRAAYALAMAALAQLRSYGRGSYGSRVLILAGAGNNGGDALYAGAQLARRGVAVSALLLVRERAHAAALAALQAAGGIVVSAVPAVVDLVLDGIVGIGGRGGLRPDAVALLQELTGTPIVAVDVPSGVDADTGIVRGQAVTADLTVTFGGLKQGLFVADGPAHAGEIRLVDIGLRLPAAQAQVLDHDDVARVLPMPTAVDDKYSRGVVGVIAGSPAYPGAGVLATGSARRGGAGMIRYLGTAPEQIRARYPDVVVHDGARPGDVRVQAWVVGPGIGTEPAAAELVREVLATDVPVIVDADAITVLADDPAPLRRKAPTVLTPHDREFLRIAGEIGADRLDAARRAARELGVTMLLKGSATVIADPDGQAIVNTTGTPWLGTAGSGDVLSGLVGSLLAAGLAPLQAAGVGAYLHGVAGQCAGGLGNPDAQDVLDQLPTALRAVRA